MILNYRRFHVRQVSAKAHCFVIVASREGTSRFDLEGNSGPFVLLKKERVKVGVDREPFARLIDALEPWLDQAVVIGGSGHQLDMHNSINDSCFQDIRPVL
jgi:hypothetical protein